MLKRCLIVLVSLVFLLSLINSFTEGDLGNPEYSLSEKYALGDYLRGWINMSLDDEVGDVLVETNQGDEIELLGLLKLNELDYSCDPFDCLDRYEDEGSGLSQEFYLAENQEKLLGIKFTGIISEIESIRFYLESDAGISCTPQLKVDILDDEEIDFINNKSYNEVCSTNYGCFKSSKSSEEYYIGDSPYCQRVRLSIAPSFELGAWVKKQSGTGELTMELYNLEGNPVDAYCVLPEASTSGSEISCGVNYQVLEDEEYYTCISKSGSGTYKIKGNSNPSELCGFNDDPEYLPTETGAYDIFAKSKKFDLVGGVSIEDNLQTGESFSDLAFDYLEGRYGSYGEINCSKGCFVPVNIISKKSQNIKISNLSAVYKKGSGTVSSTEIYELSKEAPLVTMDFQKVFLDKANFSIPSSTGSKKIKLEIDGEEVFYDYIEISEISKITGLHPTIAVAAYPINFQVETNGDEEDISYLWEFGDGTTAETEGNSIKHIYPEIGNYILKLTLIEDGFETTKEYNIQVESPKDALNTTITKKLENIKTIQSQISSLDSFKQEQIKEAVDILSLEEIVSEFQREYNQAQNDEDYVELMGKVLESKIPESVVKTKSLDNFGFYPLESVVDLEEFKDLEGGDYDSRYETQYIEYLYYWNNQNLDTKLSFEEYSLIYENSAEALIDFFNFNIAEKESVGNYYLVIQEMEDLKFKEIYSEKEGEGFVSIRLSGSNNIGFSTTEITSFEEVPVFLTPELNRYEIQEQSILLDGKTNWWVLFTLIVAFVILIGIIVYIGMQIWYKKKYEAYLFKNKNSLINLFNYINNAKRQGQKEGEIRKQLKKAGWNSEQIDYSMKRYFGKNTGMAEIPVEKVVNMFKKKEKKGGPSNNRFFNRKI